MKFSHNWPILNELMVLLSMNKYYNVDCYKIVFTVEYFPINLVPIESSTTSLKWKTFYITMADTIQIQAGI